MLEPMSEHYRVMSIPHGGGPLPIMDDPQHQSLISFLSNAGPSIGQPSAIVLVSAHWECRQPTLTSGPSPELIYDYGGFPPETYQLKYPAPGAPDVADRAAQMLIEGGFDPLLDPDRGFDHGVFVPLLLMFPDAQIPVIQLSLLDSLDPAAHIEMGSAIAPLVQDDVLILGSGFTFHNMAAFGSAMSNPGAAGAADPGNEAFEDWLSETCTSADLDEPVRSKRLSEWAEAPGARHAHPREEHLLPLHVCYGAGAGPAAQVFDDTILGKRSSGYAW